MAVDDEWDLILPLVLSEVHDIERLMRCSLVSKHWRSVAFEEDHWRLVLIRTYDAAPPEPPASAFCMAKDLYQGLTAGWNGLCLDKYTQHWMPYPISVRAVDPLEEAESHELGAWPESNMSLLLDHVKHGKSAFTGLCHWRTLWDSLTRIVGGVYQARAGTSDFRFLEEDIGKKVRWMTFTETELIKGANILVPNVYWGVLIDGVCVGSYGTGSVESGGFFMVMSEVGSASHAQAGEQEPASMSPLSLSIEAPLQKQDRLVGICVWNSAAEQDLAGFEVLRFTLENVKEHGRTVSCLLSITNPGSRSNRNSPNHLNPLAGNSAATQEEMMNIAANNMTLDELQASQNSRVRQQGSESQLRLVMQSHELKGDGHVILEAVEALDLDGERHALGDIVSGALVALGHVKIAPPISLSLFRKGQVLGGVMRDMNSSGGVALFHRDTSYR